MKQKIATTKYNDDDNDNDDVHDSTQCFRIATQVAKIIYLRACTANHGFKKYFWVSNLHVFTPKKLILEVPV